MDASADCLEPTMDVESNRWTDSVESFLKKKFSSVLGTIVQHPSEKKKQKYTAARVDSGDEND